MKLLPSLFVLAIRGYQVLIAPALHFLAGPGAGCRFEPSCSRYAVAAVATHGAARGSWLAARRLCRCHPWAKAGYDPVPPSVRVVLVKPSSS